MTQDVVFYSIIEKEHWIINKLATILAKRIITILASLMVSIESQLQDEMRSSDDDHIVRSCAATELLMRREARGKSLGLNTKIYFNSQR